MFSCGRDIVLAGRERYKPPKAARRPDRCPVARVTPILVKTVNPGTRMTDYAAARTNMVEGQIRPNRVVNQRLVDAFHEIPRELFVPKPLRPLAYVDEDLAVASGRYLLKPMVLARLLQEVEKVLRVA